MLNNIGLIGLSTMGGNLARNIANKGITIGVFNRTYQRTQDLLNLSKKLDQPEHFKNLTGYKDLQKFVQSLEVPRKIILMVKSGDPVDELIAELKPILSDQDIIIDAGNSNWQDTITREIILEDSLDFEDADEVIVSEKVIHFLGCGISGGAEGALTGPSIMLGGHKESCNLVLPMLQEIAAKDFSGKPCVAYLGKNPTGHFVKMVHNGIEYAMMQGIAEVYDIFRHLGLDSSNISSLFKEINRDRLECYLLDITLDILERKDDRTGKNLVDLISPKAEAKGTGKWFVEAGLELGVSTPNVSNAVFARIISSRNENFKVRAFSNLPIVKSVSQQLEVIISVDVKMLQDALYSIFYTSYLQGLDLILAANKEHDWSINLSEVLRIWQGGCIIRSKILLDLDKIVTSNNEIGDITNNIEFAHSSLVNLYTYLSKQSFCLPLLSVYNSSLDYCGGLIFNNLPTNLVQAQRDYFGQHGYERTDKTGNFSGGWQN